MILISCNFQAASANPGPRRVQVGEIRRYCVALAGMRDSGSSMQTGVLSTVKHPHHHHPIQTLQRSPHQVMDLNLGRLSLFPEVYLRKFLGRLYS